VQAYRDATGTAQVHEGRREDAVAEAEEAAFCKACSRFGFGLYLYHQDDSHRDEYNFHWGWFPPILVINHSMDRDALRVLNKLFCSLGSIRPLARFTLNFECMYIPEACYLFSCCLCVGRWLDAILQEVVQLGNPYGNSYVTHFLYPSITNVCLFVIPSVVSDFFALLVWWCTCCRYFVVDSCLSWGKLELVSEFHRLSTLTIKEVSFLVECTLKLFEHMVIWLNAAVTMEVNIWMYCEEQTPWNKIHCSFFIFSVM
jgi:hypothetical protein